MNKELYIKVGKWNKSINIKFNLGFEDITHNFVVINR
jgi:hypothetical protein